MRCKTDEVVLDHDTARVAKPFDSRRANIRVHERQRAGGQSLPRDPSLKRVLAVKVGDKPVHMMLQLVKISTAEIYAVGVYGGLGNEISLESGLEHAASKR